MRRQLHPILLIAFTGLASITASSLEAQTFRGDPYLVRDVNTDEDRVPYPMFFIGSFVEMGGELYFLMDDGIHGNELWKIDGRGEASLVRDVCPGICTESLGMLAGAAVNERLLFAASDGVHGLELWASDGTEEGTVLLADIAAGARSSDPRSFIVSGSVAYFSADDKQHGRELWRSDGSPEGTFMVVDAIEGPSSLAPQPFAASPGLIWLLTGGEQELWVADSSAAVSRPVTDEQGKGFSFQAVDSSLPCMVHSWAVLPDEDLLFSDWSQVAGGLWRSDGTPEGTKIVLPMERAGHFAPIGADVLFLGTTDVQQPSQLWRTDGTTAGTMMVEPLDWPWFLISTGTQAYFANQDVEHGLELWTTDGTAGGTGLVADIIPGPVGGLGDIGAFVQIPPTIFTQLGDLFLFTAEDGSHGFELWSTSGIGYGATLVDDINPGPGSSPVNRTFPSWTTGCTARLGEEIFFFAYDDDAGLGLWRSGGTPGSTRKVRDTTVQTSSTVQVRNFPLRLPMVDAGGRVFFTASDNATIASPRDHGLWVSDGTEEGTERVTAEGVSPRLYRTRLAESGGQVFFGTEDGGVWVTDGTPAGTRGVSGGGTELTPLGTSVVLISGGSGTNELLLVDGTPGGTVALAEVSQCAHRGLAGEAYAEEVGELVFVCGDEVLWRTDGSPAGTFPLPSGDRPRALTPSDGSLFYTAEVAEHGRELWLSDGSPEGTRMVADVRPGPESGLRFAALDTFPIETQPLAFRDRVYFAADDGVHGTELWSSDGSEAGTVLVGDLLPGPAGSFPEKLTVAGGRLYFVAEAPGIGRELWSTDGTLAGTRVVVDLNPGPGSSLPSDLEAIPGGGLTFAAFAPEVGRELFVLERADAIPFAVDLAPGKEPSSPSNLHLSGRHLFFVANDNVHGFELWAWLIEPDLFADGFESGDVSAWSALR